MTNWPIRGKAPLRNIRKDWERAVKRGGEVDALIAGRCTVPPQGWLCTREPGHEGPCAAHQVHVNADADLNPAEWVLLSDLMHRAFGKMAS
jgi:hypothetical protein